MPHPTSAARLAARRGNIHAARQPSIGCPPRQTARSRSPLLPILCARRCACSHQQTTSAIDSWVHNLARAREVPVTTLRRLPPGWPTTSPAAATVFPASARDRNYSLPRPSCSSRLTVEYEWNYHESYLKTVNELHIVETSFDTRHASRKRASAPGAGPIELDVIKYYAVKQRI